jgi:hypothetical protein
LRKTPDGFASSPWRLGNNISSSQLHRGIKSESHLTLAAVANSREPNAWMPLDRDEIAELRRELTRKSVEQLRKDFAMAIEMCNSRTG